MSTIGSLIVGFAVATAGVFLGKQLEKRRHDQSLNSKNANQPFNRSSPPVTIDAEKDPHTGRFKTDHKG